MYKCFGEGGGTNAARCWVACTSHWVDGWLRLPWPGCPSFQCIATSMSTAYAATDTDLSGTAWTGDIVWEIPRESPLCIHMHVDIYTSMKSGGWVTLTNYPHPRHSGVSAWGKLHGPVGCGWRSETSENWVERAPKVHAFSTWGRRSTWSQDARIYFKSLYPIYHHNLCLLVRRGTETQHRACERCTCLSVCGHACVDQRRPAFQTAGRGLGVWNARHSLTPVRPLRLNPLPISVPHGSWSNW